MQHHQHDSLKPDPRDFTVKILHPNTGITLGTGFVVSMDGKVVTCRHVVAAASADPKTKPDAEVIVYFPNLSIEEDKIKRAKVIASVSGFDDDIVLLQIVEELPLLNPEQIAVINGASASRRNEFESYGFAPIPPYIESRVTGKIQGSVRPPPGLRVISDPIQLLTEGQGITEGMSGAAVFDSNKEMVVGIIHQTYFKHSTHLLGWAVDAYLLLMPPFNLPPQEQYYKSYLDLSYLLLYMGRLAEAKEAARKALSLAIIKEDDNEIEANVRAILGWIAFLEQDFLTAERSFRRVNHLEEIEAINILSRHYVQTCILRAQYWRAVGEFFQAGDLIGKTLRTCERNKWQIDQSRCQRILGDLASDDSVQAREYYDEALRLARQTSAMDVLLEGLLARGRWAAMQNLLEEAQGHLHEALSYARERGYQLYEADLRLALAGAFLVADDHMEAQTQATQARDLSRDMGYKRGQTDAEDFLQRLIKGEEPVFKPPAEMEEPRVSLWLHGWARQDYGPPPTYELDWTSFFDRKRRKILTQKDWDVQMVPALDRVRENLALRPDGRFIDFRGKLPLTVSLAVGAVFPEVAGFRFRTEQITGGLSQFWRSDAPPSERNLQVIEQDRRRAGKDLLVALCLTGQAWEEVADFYHNHPKFKGVVYAEPDCGAGSEALQGATDATALARDAKELLRHFRGQFKASRLHLILFAPAAFCLFLGQKLNALGDILTYERKVTGGYQKSLLLRTG